mgnify:FL=1
MDQIIWKDEYSIGITEIDEQHKHIITIINQFIINSDLPTTRSEEISDLLCELTNYCIEHFDAEERIMKHHNYQGMDEHIEEHLVFRKTMVDICKATTHGIKDVPAMLQEFLHSWLVDHVLVTDMKLKSIFDDSQL